MSGHIARAAVAGLFVAACASAAAPPSSSAVDPVATVPPVPAAGPRGTDAPLPVSRPSTAVTPEPEPEAPPPEEPPEIPSAPAKLEASGAAALIWVPDPKAAYGFATVLVTRARGKTKVVAERKEPVLASSRELWVLRSKKLASRGCAECEACSTDPPSCRQDELVEITEPYLKSLTSGRTFEPWKGSFGAQAGCKDSVGGHDTELQLHGGVGRFFFFSVNSWIQYCGGAHPMFGADEVTLDIDRGVDVDLSFPAVVTPLLKKRAQLELGAECVSDPKEEPAEYRALASYSPKGELQGAFQFTMTAPYMCGTGPGHYTALSEQVSDWIPPELESWGRLPDWVAEYVADKDARHAFLIGDKRSQAVAREMKRR